MSGFGDPVGRALLDRSVLRITDVDFDFEVYGYSLQEIGEEAAARARNFYGAHDFEIKLSVYDPDGGSLYRATVRTTIR